MKKLMIIILAVLFLISCNHEYQGVPESYHKLLDIAIEQAGDNAEEIKKAISESPAEQKEGMAFLISYMPERDLTSLGADFLLENVEYAYRAREEFSWCKNLPDSIFFNEVLPYANTSEDRDPWRKDFYERFSLIVKDCENIVDAIYTINKPINTEVKVEYDTRRSRVDASPKQSMEEHMATCTGLSMILTDAFRSVGIPSRLAGTGMWTNMKGNHTWSEVWVDGEWMFTEYYPDTLNKSWFVADAGKADPENEIHWIYAVSYKPTGMYYGAGTQAMHLINKIDPDKIPASWKPRIERMKASGIELPEPYVYGHNVTQRYIDIYRQSMSNSELNEDECLCNLVVYKNAESKTSQGRTSCLLEVFEDGNKVDFGYSPSSNDDNNNFLKFKLKKNTSYEFILSDQGQADYKKKIPILTNNEAIQDIALIFK
ncbi:MAG: transglutaminase domain-containing protein [Bacteroidetes bacterium]|jgi:hypothetical protein|nr:transglutaminase domain-containing protein [Bacteroidota bacterium]MBT3748319.1 transglutaminase domain-containing protein [Bacteroidota bacterium]MBT4411353.1 transglutaminase domain-containing protein [Bacteroidota bacterium]MBT7091619.1 transglutaminase domain-containing protein [Bacteroidota bacterium]MBT7464402.1 transglutaminase domain-containing protein [Bacteroidota bacterium]